MKRILAALALCAPLIAGAADLDISCLGPESDDCPMAVNLNPDMEALFAFFDGQRNGDGSVGRVAFLWCTPFTLMGNAPLQWLDASSTTTCALTGKSRPINGELTKRQMAQAALVFETRRSQVYCSAIDRPPGCTTMPLFPARADKVTVACITDMREDCPVVVDATLDKERLIAGFRQLNADGTGRWTELEWCGNSTAGGQPSGWVPIGQNCVLSGRFRTVNGELSMRQLAQGSIQFTTRKIEAVCKLEGAGNGEIAGKPVCRR
ncbi:hypothetical protein PMI14_00968 [Acidovorax sp. CF316]|uniref:hypothetical protein n=1 Tax=Acidovorax sp. CF316 TaxID=1144317 RepID=UPI00026BBE9B|nr:hypothetical protein [Acidovorax sp. CF316]EJE54137.1 hypothetical protein PMI14_00968 [Acidovorax sp. CF316]